MASGETNKQALYEQLAAACAEQERASVEHCAEQGNVPMCSEQFETAMKRIVLQLNERPQHRQLLGGGLVIMNKIGKSQKKAIFRQNHERLIICNNLCAFG